MIALPALPNVSNSSSLTTRLCRSAMAACVALLAGCGSGDAPPPAEVAPSPTPTTVAAIAPTILQQPTSVTTMPGQSASFSVTATGTMPLNYQWQRGGVAITGATSSTYTLASTALTDSGSTFRVVVSNVAGSATSDNAPLTVSPASPVLSIAPQPMSQSVLAGAMVTFTVGGACSNGVLTVQWQRLGASAFADIAGATSPGYTFTAASTDNGAQFRAVLSCSGASTTTSSVATLTVTMPSSVTLSAIPVVGRRAQAPMHSLEMIDPAPGGGWDFIDGNSIRHLAADLSSATLVAGATYSTGDVDGPVATATFQNLVGIAHAANGTIYVVDQNNDSIRMISGGTVSTLAGPTTRAGGYVDATGSAARFFNPAGIAMGPDGDLYVADSSNNVVRRVTTTGVVTTYAGNGSAGYADALIATSAQFTGPFAIAIAANGDLYVSDQGNHRVRRIVRNGNGAGAVQTIAGNGSNTLPGTDGPGITAGIAYPNALTLVGTTLYVLDGAGLIRTVDTVTGVVATFAGSRTLGSGYADGPVGAGRIDIPAGIAIAANGGFIVADYQRGLRTVDASGTITTLANGQLVSGYTSDDTSIGVLAQLPFELIEPSNERSRQTSIVVDASGGLAVSESKTRTVRRIDTAGNVSLLAGLDASFGGPLNGTGSAAQFVSNGAGLAIAADGTLYTSAAYGVMRIRTDGTTIVLAGSATTFGNVDGGPTIARFQDTGGLSVGPSGDLFVADTFNNAIRRIDANGNTTTFANVTRPTQLHFAPDGTLYVVANGNLQRVTTTGVVSPLPAAGVVSDVAIDAAGNIYITQSGAIALFDPNAGSITRLITTGPGVVLGNVAPSLGMDIGAIYEYGPKQLVIVSQQQFLLLTLP
jgi:hypothetical protein